MPNLRSTTSTSLVVNARLNPPLPSADSGPILSFTKQQTTSASGDMGNLKDVRNPKNQSGISPSNRKRNRTQYKQLERGEKLSKLQLLHLLPQMHLNLVLLLCPMWQKMLSSQSLPMKAIRDSKATTKPTRRESVGRLGWLRLHTNTSTKKIAISIQHHVTRRHQVEEHNQRI